MASPLGYGIRIVARCKVYFVLIVAGQLIAWVICGRLSISLEEWKDSSSLEVMPFSAMQNFPVKTKFFTPVGISKEKSCLYAGGLWESSASNPNSMFILTVPASASKKRASGMPIALGGGSQSGFPATLIQPTPRAAD